MARQPRFLDGEADLSRVVLSFDCEGDGTRVSIQANDILYTCESMDFGLQYCDIIARDGVYYGLTQHHSLVESIDRCLMTTRFMALETSEEELPFRNQRSVQLNRVIENDSSGEVCSCAMIEGFEGRLEPFAGVSRYVVAQRWEQFQYARDNLEWDGGFTCRVNLQN